MNLLRLRVMRIRQQCDRDIENLQRQFADAGDEQIEQVKQQYGSILEKLQRDLREVHLDAHKQRLCDCTEVI